MSIIKQLKEEIDLRKRKIKFIQDKCSHPEEAVTKKHGSNTGNYDPSVDCYWVDFYCTLCEKSWRKGV